MPDDSGYVGAQDLLPGSAWNLAHGSWNDGLATGAIVSIDCLMPNGLIIPMQTEPHITLVELKKVRQFGMVSNASLLLGFTLSNFFFFLGSLGGGKSLSALWCPAGQGCLCLSVYNPVWSKARPD